MLDQPSLANTLGVLSYKESVLHSVAQKHHLGQKAAGAHTQGSGFYPIPGAIGVEGKGLGLEA